MIEAKTYEILNSDGKITLETRIKTKIGTFRSSLPIGTSAGKYEAKYNLKKIKRELTGKFPDVDSLEEIFQIEKKMKNPPLTLSFAMLKYLAAKKDIQVYQLLGKKRMPYLWNKIVGGGKHAGGPAIQEFLISVRSKDFEERIRIAEEVHKEFGKKLIVKGRDLEGGWVINADSISVLKMLKNVVDKVSDKYSVKIWMGIDVAASDIYINKKYVYKEFILKKSEQPRFINDLIKEFKLKYVEDPVEENDLKGCEKIKAKYVVGDDLTVSNPMRLNKVKGINGVIAKPNQIGYLYKFIEFINKAKKKGYNIFVSHRSKETNDNILADLAVAFGDMKIGLVGGERVSKLNRLLKIWKENF